MEPKTRTIEMNGWHPMRLAPTYQYLLLKSASKEIGTSGAYHHEYAVAQYEDWDEAGWFDQDGMLLDFVPVEFMLIPGEVAAQPEASLSSVG